MGGGCTVRPLDDLEAHAKIESQILAVAAGPYRSISPCVGTTRTVDSTSPPTFRPSDCAFAARCTAIGAPIE